MPGGYNIYRGVGGPSSIDYANPVAFAAAGSGTIDLVGLGHSPGVEYYYGVRCVSDAGVEEANTDRVVRVEIDANGQLVGPPPNRVASASARPAAAGKIRVDFFYGAGGQAGIATGVQVARVVNGTPDWANLIQTIGVAGTVRRSVELTPTFGHGETVELAVRAVTADGATGPVTRLAPVAADAVGPEPVSWIKAEQAS